MIKYYNSGTCGRDYSRFEVCITGDIRDGVEFNAVRSLHSVNVILDPEQALHLGEALIAHAKRVGAKPPPAIEGKSL